MAGEKEWGDVVDGADGFFWKEKGRIEVGIMDEVEFFFHELKRQEELFAVTVPARSNEDFFDAIIRWCKFREFRLAHEHDIFVFCVNFKQGTSEFFNVSADAGALGVAVHAGVYGDFHVACSM